MARKKRAKRPNGDGTIIELANGRFRAEISVRAPDGSRSRRSKTERTRADAGIALRQLRNEAATGSPDEPEEITLGGWLRQRHDLFAAAGWAADSVDDRQRSVELHLVPHVGAVLLHTLTAAHVEGLLGTWQATGVGMRTREKAFRVLASAVEVARARGVVRGDPLHGIDRPKSRRINVDPYTADEMHAILLAARGRKLEAFWWLALGTGMRLGEMIALPRRCVDLDAATLRVERTGKYRRNVATFRPPKTARSRRTIELPARVVQALRDHAAALERRKVPASELVFPAENGRMLRSENVRRNSWWPILTAAGLRTKLDRKTKRPVGPAVAPKPIHQTRHTYATLQLLAGVPVPVVSAVLGHASPGITLDIYSHYAPSHQALAREAADRMFGPGG